LNEKSIIPSPSPPLGAGLNIHLTQGAFLTA
jgi:hypothetical protein